MRKILLLSLLLLPFITAAKTDTKLKDVRPGNVVVPNQAGQSGKFLSTDGSNLLWATGGGGGGSGTVTSVGLMDNSATPIFSISGSPVTTAGTLLETLVTQSANKIFAGPTTGAAAQPTFRSIVSADIPTLNQNTTGTAANITATSNSTLTTLSALSLPYSQVTGTPTINKETFILSSTDITNQYIDLTHVSKTNAINLIVKGLPPTLEGVSYDYSVNYTGGAGGNTRITFLNELATGGASALVAGNVLQVLYTY